MCSAVHLVTLGLVFGIQNILYATISYFQYFWLYILNLYDTVACYKYNKTDRQCTYNVPLRSIHETIVAVEKQ